MAARPDDAPDADDRSPADGHDDPVARPGRTAGEPSAGGTDQDEAWASIVARLDDLRDLDVELGAPDEDGVDAAATDAHVVRPVPTTGPAVLAGRDWDGTAQQEAAEAAVDEQEHFVPPDPGPVLGGDPLLTMAWSAVVAVPLLLLVVALVWRDAPDLLVRGAVVLFVAAVGLLVWRMPHRREPDDDETGAVV